MDAYAQILEHLRADDHRRLREFARAPRCRVSTWLVVVSRRVCLDLYRQRYGRPASEDGREQRRARRRLQDLVAEQLELHEPATTEREEADAALRHYELHDALQRALTDLPPRDLLMLKLRFVDDLAAQEIARLLAFPSPFHVYRRLNCAARPIARHPAPPRRRERRSMTATRNPRRNDRPTMAWGISFSCAARARRP